jgi:hypothetical protein
MATISILHQNIIKKSKKRTHICHVKYLAVNLYTVYKTHTVAFEFNCRYIYKDIMNT